MTFTIVKTQTTPSAEFRDGHLSIKGKSVPFNHPEIYDIIIERLNIYVQSPKEETLIDFNLSAANAATKRSIINIFSFLEKIDTSSTCIRIIWYYHSDDEDILELGEFCKSNFDLQMEIELFL